MSAERYFGNSRIEITKDGKKYWRIKTKLPGTHPTDICGSEPLDVSQDEYIEKERGPGCGNPAKARYRYERKDTGAGAEQGELEEVAEQLEDAAAQLEQGAEKLSAGASAFY